MMSSYNFKQIPFDRIVRVGQKTLLHRDLFCVSWLLGRFCNYKCSYCWPYGRSDQRDHRPTPVILNALDEIKQQARLRGFNSFHFSFSGGEPTLHPGYLTLLEALAKDRDQCRYQSVHMTSNLSPGVGWFRKYLAITKTLSRVSVTASFHREFAKRDVFRDKLLMLIDGGAHVTINMVMVPDRFEDLWKEALYFQSHRINVTLKPQSNSTATRVVDGYTPDQLERLQTGLPQRDSQSMNWEQRFQVLLTDDQGLDWEMDQAERFNAFGFNQFQGWECSAGYRSIIIREPDGLVKRSYSCNDAPLGHIESGFQLFEQIQTCKTKSCVSSADSKIPKRKPSSTLPLWPTSHDYR